MQNFILTDGRWQGTHGIGRFSAEVLSRLTHTDILTTGPRPLSLTNLYWQPYHLFKNKNSYRVLFNPGFNPILASPIPFVFTIHDLIHLNTTDTTSPLKKIYYELFIKNSAKKAYKILTVSEYSKKKIIEWTQINEEKIIVVGNGISSVFTATGTKHQPGYPYLLHVGNTKAHKNVARLILAFAAAKIDTSLRLILTGNITPAIDQIINQHELKNRIIFSGQLSDEKLAEYYRGAQAFLLPSLHEGFGIPVIEAMACGIPTLVANTTSLPEIAGNAAIYIDPYSIESIKQGIEKISTDEKLRDDLTKKGFAQIKLFSWDITANKIQTVLNSFIA